ncbi:hypothetical protein CGZ65_11000 [Neisseria weixii]|nr:hypothetical protein CGZ65_11000 [Neisseria weixii]
MFICYIWLKEIFLIFITVGQADAVTKLPDVDAVQGVAAQRVQTYHTIGMRASSIQRRNAQAV